MIDALDIADLGKIDGDKFALDVLDLDLRTSGV
jgi:hypothetical protein